MLGGNVVTTSERDMKRWLRIRTSLQVSKQAANREEVCTHGGSVKSPGLAVIKRPCMNNNTPSPEELLQEQEPPDAPNPAKWAKNRASLSLLSVDAVTRALAHTCSSNILRKYPLSTITVLSRSDEARGTSTASRTICHVLHAITHWWG
jgi:hypothetical protein